MPSLSFMGRRLGVGGDEFAVPSMCSMLLRVFWSGAVILMLVETHAALSGCEAMHLVYAYFALSIACFLAAIALEWAILATSLRGAIAEADKRRGMGRLLGAHAVLGGFQLALAALGLALFATFEGAQCVAAAEAEGGEAGAVDAALVRVLLLVVCLSQVVDAVVMGCCCWLVVGPRTEDAGLLTEGAGAMIAAATYERLASDDVEALWAERCRGACEVMSCLSCRVFGGANSLEADFAHLARVMARIFHTEEYLDIVPSDVAAGVVLLRASQREGQKRRERRRQTLHPTESTRPSLDAVLREPGVGDAVADAAPRDLEAGLGALSRSSGGGGGGGGGGGDGQSVPASMKARSEEHAKWWRVAGRRVLDVDSGADRRVLEEATHFSRYALAIYTWYLYVFDRPCCGGCDLCLFGTLGCARRFHRSRRRRALARLSATWDGAQAGAPRVDGDNCWRVNEAGLLRIAGLHDCELVYATFAGGMQQTPYAVFVDHEWQCVVISIRGTMSLDDCIVDALAEPMPMDESGKRWGFDGRDMWAHQGTVDRAEWIRTDLEEKGILKQLLGTEGGSASPLAAHCRGYSVRVTGHSLGAGAAVLITHMLKRDYPTIRCLALSPPGGLMDAAHARACRPFVLSLILHNDMVPRMSIIALENMRDHVLDLIGRARVNKTTVMRSLVRRPKPDASEMLYAEGEPCPETAYHRQLLRYKTWVTRVREEKPQMVLHPPGALLHIVKTGRGRGRMASYTPVWAEPEQFKELVVSASMFTDHWPTRLVPILEHMLSDMVKESREAQRDADTAAARDLRDAAAGEHPSSRRASNLRQFMETLSPSKPGDKVARKTR